MSLSVSNSNPVIYFDNSGDPSKSMSLEDAKIIAKEAKGDINNMASKISEKLNIPKDHVEAILKPLDKNGDGKISSKTLTKLTDHHQVMSDMLSILQSATKGIKEFTSGEAGTIGFYGTDKRVSVKHINSLASKHKGNIDAMVPDLVKKTGASESDVKDVLELMDEKVYSGNGNGKVDAGEAANISKFHIPRDKQLIYFGEFGDNSKSLKVEQLDEIIKKYDGKISKMAPAIAKELKVDKKAVQEILDRVSISKGKIIPETLSDFAYAQQSEFEYASQQKYSNSINQINSVIADISSRAK